eukprot:1152182-Pelagomonas_calceolata.AAC.9
MQIDRLKPLVGFDHAFDCLDLIGEWKHLGNLGKSAHSHPSHPICLVVMDALFGHLEANDYLKSIHAKAIDTGGEMVSCIEVEEAVLKALGDQHPELYAVAFAVPHTLLQEAVGLAMVMPSKTRPDLAELHHALAPLLPPFKWPADERIFEAKLNHDCMMDASIPIPCQPAGHNQERWARYCMRGNKDESKFSLVYKSIISSAKQRA